MKREHKFAGNLLGFIAYGAATGASLANLVISIKQKDREEILLSTITGIATGIMAYICYNDMKHNNKDS